MYTKIIVSALLLSSISHALVPLARSVGGSCTGSGGNTGVCIDTGDCTADGGTFVSDECPHDPNNIKCCTKTKCGPSDNGKCQFTSTSCSGSYLSNHCPGGDNFKCFVPDTGSGGGSGYPTPSLPSSSSGCKAVAIDGAKAIIDQFPGKVKEIGCIRSCSDPSSSDHCTGHATDMMVADGGVN